MSLVNYFATEDFLLFCGDQRAIKDNGEVIENFIKVRKTRNNVLFGFCGQSIFNSVLCHQYVSGDLTFKPLTVRHNYNQISNQVRENLRLMEIEGTIKDEVGCCIGGWNGERLCISL